MDAAATELMEPAVSGPITLVFGGQELVVTPSPAVRAERRGAWGRMERAWPIGRMLAPAPDGGWTCLPGWSLPGGLSWADVFPSVPADLIRLVSRLTSRQWPLLEFANNHPAFRDLLRSNPVLAFALACNGEFRDTTQEDASRRAGGWAASRQREIAKALRFPATESTVRIFRQIMPEAASPSALRMLRGALPLAPKLAKLISHMERINAGVLAFIAQAPLQQAVTPRLLEELAASGEELERAPTADLVADVVRMGRGIRGWALTPILSRARAKELHDLVLLEHLAEQERVRRKAEARREQERRLREEQERQHSAWLATRRRAEEQRARCGKAFPTPPLPGSAHIVPIVSEPGLLLEGLKQKNCVGGFIDSVRSGDMYFYRVLSPERATLQVVRSGGGGWVPRDVKLKANRAVCPDTVSAVRAWAASHANQGQSPAWDETPF